MSVRDSASRRKFVAAVKARLREAGATEIAYDDASDQITFCVAQCDDRDAAHGVLDVERLYIRWRGLSKPQREAMMEAILTLGMFNIIDVVANISADALVPVVRTRTWLQAREGLALAAEERMPHRPIGSSLCVSLALELPGAIAYVGKEHLEAGGPDFDTALEQALLNIAPDGPEFAEVAVGVHRASWNDGFDVERMLFGEVMNWLPISGNPVVVAPAEQVLLVAGADDPAGLANLVKLAEEEFTSASRAISGCAVVLPDGSWHDYVPPESANMSVAFKNLRRLTLERHYRNQARLAEKDQSGALDGLCFAPYLVGEDRDTGELITFTAWIEGCASVLPHAEWVGLKGADGASYGPLRWDEFERRFGPLERFSDLEPPRFLVGDVPDAARLAELGLRPATDGD